MFKFSGLFDLKPGVDAEETWRHWRERHVLYAKEYLLPGARKYHINRVKQKFGEADVWGISEFWFDDMETALTAVGRLQKAPPDDFYIQRIKPAKRVLLREEVVDLPAPAEDGHSKVVTIFSLKPGVDGDAAYKIWRDKHASRVKGTLPPGATRFTINRVVHRFRETDMYGYSMVWFADETAAVKAAEQLRETAPDDFLSNYVAVSMLVVVEEEKVEL